MNYIVLNLSLGTQKVTTVIEIHRLLHDIPRIFIFFIEQLCFIFNQLLSIGSIGRRAICIYFDNMFQYSLGYESHCFKFISGNAKSWVDANSFCNRTYHGTLATVNDR